MSQPPDGREQRLGRAFVTLADTLVDDYNMIGLLNRLVSYSVELLDADEAGIVLADGHGELQAVAATSEDAQLIELLQLQAEQGPCLDCFHNSAPVSVPDLSQAADRWPRFIDASARQGAFASVHAMPLRLRGHAVGALNLLHRVPGPLSDGDLAMAQALADIATIGILQERAIRRHEVLNEQLQTALTSRIIIEQAKGVLAQHFGLDMDQAFNRLRGYARGRGLRLAEVARQLVARELDPDTLIRGAPDTRHSDPR